MSIFFPSILQVYFESLYFWAKDVRADCTKAHQNILKGSIGVVSDLFKFFFYIEIKILPGRLKTIIITLNFRTPAVSFIRAWMKDTAVVQRFSIIIIVFNLSSKFLIVI